MIGVPDGKWGARPLVIVVLIEGAEERIAADGLQEHRQHLVADGVIATWAVPDHYTFVKELPKASGGKIDKKVLRSRYPAAPNE